MINYELAKQLYKDGTFKSPVPVTEANEKYLEYPPLSELIEACGDGCDSIYRISGLVEDEKEVGDAWIANNGKGLDMTGITPEEAVANLYIAINQ